MALDGSFLWRVRQRFDFELSLEDGEEAAVIPGSFFFGACVLASESSAVHTKISQHFCAAVLRMVCEAFCRTAVDATWEVATGGTQQWEGEGGAEERGDEGHGGRGFYGAEADGEYVSSWGRTGRSAGTLGGPAAARRPAPSRSTAD